MKNINMKDKKDKETKDLSLTRMHPTYSSFLDIMRARVKLAVEINEARVSRGWSQQELARSAKTTQKVISKIESGDTNIGFDLLNRLLNCLDLLFQIGKTELVSGDSESSTSFTELGEYSDMVFSTTLLSILGNTESSSARSLVNETIR